MKQEQQNHLHMCKTVYKVMEDHAGVWSGNILLEEANSQLDAHIQDMEGVARKQSKGSRGATRQKAMVKNSLVSETVRVASILWSYADNSGQEDLKPVCEVSRSDLRQMTDADLTGHCSMIADLLNANIDGLEDFFFLPPAAVAYENLVTSFSARANDPRAEISKRSGATRSVPAILRKAFKVLRYRMDGGMMQYKDSHPEFFLAYKSARKIVDRGIRHTEKPGDGIAA